jgi:sarcosine oxidase
VAKAQRVRLRRFDADTLCDRYPQFQVPPKTVAYLEADAGYVWPQRCIKAQLDAVADQSRLRFGETVLERSQVGGRVRIRTNLATYEAERAVVAMGAWIPGFIGGPFQRDMRVLRQTLHWFRADEPELWRGEAAPVFLWFHGPRAADVFYGFPLTRGGRPGVKVATEQYAVETAPDDLVRAVSAAESDAMFREHVAGRLRGVSSEPVAAEACLYTYNQGQGQDGRFRIGPDPDAPASLVVSACSGHGFKHSAGLGEAIVRDLCGEAPLCDLSVFGPAA